MNKQALLKKIQAYGIWCDEIARQEENISFLRSSYPDSYRIVEQAKNELSELTKAKLNAFAELEDIIYGRV